CAGQPLQIRRRHHHTLPRQLGQVKPPEHLPGCHLLGRCNLPAAPGHPAHHSLHLHALVPELRDAALAMALGQAFAIGPHHPRHSSTAPPRWMPVAKSYWPPRVAVPPSHTDWPPSVCGRFPDSVAGSPPHAAHWPRPSPPPADPPASRCRETPSPPATIFQWP